MKSNDWKDRLGVMYSTNPDFQYNTGESAEEETLPKEKQQLRIALDKRNRGGKAVTLVTGFRGTTSDLEALGKFLKVNLSVFDNDGMEGFYVPESAFRDFMKEAGASTVQQNISFESESGYGSGISGEAIALQALQNMYNSATSAVSANIRKNKAKIKYNTIVYLINSDEAY